MEQIVRAGGVRSGVAAATKHVDVFGGGHVGDDVVGQPDARPVLVPNPPSAIRYRVAHNVGRLLVIPAGDRQAAIVDQVPDEVHVPARPAVVAGCVDAPLIVVHMIVDVPEVVRPVLKRQPLAHRPRRGDHVVNQVLGKDDVTSLLHGQPRLTNVVHVVAPHVHVVGGTIARLIQKPRVHLKAGAAGVVDLIVQHPNAVGVMPEHKTVMVLVRLRA